MNNGKIIYQATEILKKTYDEINRMRDDISQFVKKYPKWGPVNEYSYGPKTLYLKSNHIIWFKRELKEEKETEFLVLRIIFYSDYIKLISTQDEPEIWVGYLKRTKNEKEDPWDFENIFQELNNADNQILKFNGEVNEGKIDKTKDKLGIWEYRVVGYSLVAISSKEKIKELIIDKLFKK